MKLKKRKGITLPHVDKSFWDRPEVQAYWKEAQQDVTDEMLYGNTGMYYVRFSGSILTEVLDEAHSKIQPTNIWSGTIGNTWGIDYIQGLSSLLEVTKVDKVNGTITVGKK